MGITNFNFKNLGVKQIVSGAQHMLKHGLNSKTTFHPIRKVTIPSKLMERTPVQDALDFWRPKLPHLETGAIEVLEWPTYHPRFDERLQRTVYTTLWPKGSDNYNCIAHTVGINDKTVWPPNIYRDEKDDVVAFDKFYAEHGYTPLEKIDLSFTPGIQKIAMFAYQGNPIHGIVQTKDGKWTSKMDHHHLMKFDSVHQLEDGHFGDLFRVYAKPIK